MNLAVMFINSKRDYYPKQERLRLSSRPLSDSPSPASRSFTSLEDLPETPVGRIKNVLIVSNSEQIQRRKDID